MAGADLLVLPGIELLDTGGGDFTLGEIGRRKTPFVCRYFVQDLGTSVKPLTIGARKFQPVFDHEVEKLFAVVQTCCGTRFPVPQALDILLFVFSEPALPESSRHKRSFQTSLRRDSFDFVSWPVETCALSISRK
jgi:hypothetical protein